MQSAENVNFTLEGPTSVQQSQPVNGDYVSYEFESGELTSGDYTLTALSYNGTDTEIDEISRDVTVDGSSPDIIFPENLYVSDDPEITVEFSDEHTGVASYTDGEGNDYVDNNAEVSNVNGFSSCSAGNTCTVDYEIDTSEVDDGASFQLDLDAEDQVGNPGSGSETFEFDNSFDASSPEFSIPEADGDNNVFMSDENEDRDIDVTVDDGDDNENSDIQVTCYDGNDDQIDQTDFQYVDDSDYTFTCELQGDDYAGTTTDLYVEACDEAGNCESSDTRTYSFDTGNPFVGSFETSESYTVFNGDFNVSYDAGDDASGVEEMEYFFDDTTNPGEGNTVDIDSDGQFTVDTSTLSRGQHTVYFRVRDGVDRWSDIASFGFEFYPNERPEVGIDVPSGFNITAGQSGSLQATIENTGRLFVESVEVSTSGTDFVSGGQNLTNLASGDSVPVNLELDPDTSDIGEHKLVVETDQPSASTEVNLLVEANPDQQENVESMLSNYSSRLEDLESNISGLRGSGLSEDLNRSLQSNTSDFVQSVRDAESFVERGEYYRALTELEGVSEKYEEAKNSYQKVKEQHKLNRRNQLLKMAGVAVVFLVVVAGVYVAREEEFDLDFDLEQYQVPELGGIGETVNSKIDDLKEFIEKEEEEVEEGFQGFR